MFLSNNFKKYSLIFSLNNEFRLILIDKYFIKNIYQLPNFKKIVLSIFLKNLDNLDNVQFISSFFLLTFLSGKKPFIVKLNIFQTFKKKRFDIFLKIDLRKPFFYEFLSYFYLYILPKMINKVDFVTDIQILEKKKININYLINNLNFIKIVDTNPIFFKYKYKLNIDFYLKINIQSNNSKFINSILTFLKFFTCQ